MSYLTMGALGAEDPCGSYVDAEIRALEAVKAVQANVDAARRGGHAAVIAAADAAMTSAQAKYAQARAAREKCRSTVRQPTKQLVNQNPVNLAPRADAHDPYVNFEARKLANAAAENVNAFYKELQGIKLAIDTASSSGEVERLWQAALAESRAFSSGPQTAATKQRGAELVQWVRSAKDAAVSRINAAVTASAPQGLSPQQQVALARAKQQAELEKARSFIADNPIQNAPENTGAITEREFDRMLAMAMLRTQEQQQAQQGSTLNTMAGVVLAGGAAFAILALAVKGLGK